MKSQTFLIAQLDKLVEKMPYIQLKYEFEGIGKTHCVEVLPINLFKNNKSYIDFEMDLILSFITLFPHENLVFLSENSLYKIEKPIYVKTGTLFGISKEPVLL